MRKFICIETVFCKDEFGILTTEPCFIKGNEYNEIPDKSLQEEAAKVDMYGLYDQDDNIHLINPKYFKEIK